MILGGLIWFTVALVPVLFLAVKTMRHNLYLPVIGLAAVMGLAVEALFRRAGERRRGLATAALVYFFAAYFVSSALAVRTYWRAGWPVLSCRAAQGSLDDLMRELVGSGTVPALSQLTGSGGFANARLNDALGHVAFEYVESRWGPTGIRRFLNALIVPRVDKTYDAVFDLTPAEFDAAFRQYAEHRFRPALR